MAKYDISDEHFQFCCCWTCDHCRLDISSGYECCAVSDKHPAPLGWDNEIIHKDRRGCKGYKRG